MGCSKSSSKSEVYSNTILPQETRNISNKKPKLTPKAIRERRTKNSKLSRGKEIIKIRSEIIEKEMKEIIAKINKTKSWFFGKINIIDKPLARIIKKKREEEELQDGGRVRCGDHLPLYKYIRNTSTCGTTPTEHLLNTGRRPQTSQKARNSPRTWVGQKKKEKTETKE